jgi:hypothetical protein
MANKNNSGDRLVRGAAEPALSPLEARVANLLLPVGAADNDAQSERVPTAAELTARPFVMIADRTEKVWQWKDALRRMWLPRPYTHEIIIAAVLTLGAPLTASKLKTTEPTIAKLIANIAVKMVIAPTVIAQVLAKCGGGETSKDAFPMWALTESALGANVWLLADLVEELGAP